MATPRIYTGFKPVAAGYSIGAPDGAELTAVGGGQPAVAGRWSRGKQQVQLSRVMAADEFQVFTLWLHFTIRNGALQFLIPLDLGMGLQDHLAQLVPGSYSAVPLAASLWWSVTFSVLTENAAAYAMTMDEAEQQQAEWYVFNGGSVG